MTDAYVAEKKPQVSGFPINSAVILVAGLAALYFNQHSAALVILTLSAMTVLLIIFGERFALDLWLEARGIPGREAIIPLFAMGIAVALGAVSPATIPQVFKEKIDIIVFILAFAVIAEGIGRSGYFAFAAYKIVYKCQGNTTRLILYLFVLASILTLFTSNDIVVLVLTPIIISVCVHAGISNTRLLLLAQFVAANTLSMGLLIGSPTNIILGETLHIDFFTYLALMIVPAILSCMLSMIVIDWINQQSRPGTSGLFVKRWSYTDTYRIPAFARTAHFTTQMQRWLSLFLLAVLWLAIVSALNLSLFWSAIPTALCSFALLYKEAVEDTGSPKAATRDILKLLQFLPYGILFFGMCFFVFAAELARLNYVETVLLPFVRAHLLNDAVHASLSMIFLSGMLVNTLNDLPTAALLGEMLKHMEASGGALSEYMRIIVIQAFLVGVNIGCYVTPIGALAGILWFNIIKKEERRQRAQMEKQANIKMSEMAMPTRADMVLYGVMHFIFVALVLGYLLPFFVQMADILISSPDQAENSPLNGMISIGAYLPYIGFGLLAFTVMTFRNVLRRGNVMLGHMREVFVVMTRVSIWAMKNRGMYFVLMVVGLMVGASGLLFWTEAAHDRIYGMAAGAKPLFDSASSFIIWVMVFTGSGMQDNFKPHSTLGLALISVLPLMAVGAIVVMAQLSSGKNLINLSRRLAKGDIPSYRIVVVNYHSRFANFIRTSLFTKDASILLLCDPAHYDQAVSFCAEVNTTEHGGHRLYAAIKHADPYHNFHEYRIEQADEIYLLSDMTTQGEYEKLRYVTKLDALLNATRVSSVEGLEAGVAGASHSAQDDAAEIDDLAGMPRIFIETPSERFRELLQRSSSPLLLRAAIRATFEHDVADYLMGDMDESLEMLNSYYRTGGATHLPGLFVGGRSPLEKITLKAYELDEKGKALFRKHFSGFKLDVKQDTRALRQLSTVVRATVAQATTGARYIDGAQHIDIDYTRLMGLIMKVGAGEMHIGIPSAALSMQAVQAEKIILRVPATESSWAAKPQLSGGGTVFIFNFTPHARAFILEMLGPFGKEKKPRIVILAYPQQIVPDDIALHPAVHVMHCAQAEDMVNIICPVDGGAKAGQSKAQGKQAFRPLLKKGDRVYVFLDFDRPNPDTASIDFIDSLDTQIHQLMHQAKPGQPPALNHPDLYLVVETLGSDSRFLFENFFLDKIIDSSLPRQSFMEILSMIFHRALADKTLLGYAHGSVSHFHQAAEIATCLCRYYVKYAQDVILKDQAGAELRLTGKSFAQAITEIRSYAMPPMQLIARMRIVAVAEQQGKHQHKGFRLAEVPEDEPLRDDDLLLNLPMI